MLQDRNYLDSIVTMLIASAIVVIVLLSSFLLLMMMLLLLLLLMASIHMRSKRIIKVPIIWKVIIRRLLPE